MKSIIFFLLASSVVWCQKSEFYSDRDKAPPGVDEKGKQKTFKKTLKLKVNYTR